MTTPEKMASVQSWYSKFGGLVAVLTALETVFSSAAQRQEWTPVGMVRECMENMDDIPF
jgi:hypothetical protein